MTLGFHHQHFSSRTQAKRIERDSAAEVHEVLLGVLRLAPPTLIGCSISDHEKLAGGERNVLAPQDVSSLHIVGAFPFTFPDLAILLHLLARGTSMSVPF